jgi:hypothetical protein
MNEAKGMQTEFVVGGRYENRKGPYEVVAIYGSMMTIRWDIGDQIETDIRGQLRVLRNMEREFQDAQSGSRQGHVPGFYGELFRGMQECDFSEDVTGTRWRSREQLGGAVAKCVAAQYPVDSWAIYHRPEVHWANRTRYTAKDAWFQAKFQAVAGSEGLRAGFYVERPDNPNDNRDDWNRFVSWLMNGGESILAKIVARYELRISDECGEDEPFCGWIGVGEHGWEHHCTDGSLVLIPQLHAFLSDLKQECWIDLIIQKNYKKTEALKLGPAIASEIGSILTALLPVYEAAVQG